MFTSLSKDPPRDARPLYTIYRPLSRSYLSSVYNGVSIHKRQNARDCLRCSHLHCRLSISGPSTCRSPIDRSAPRDTINTSILVVTRETGPSGSRISDTIGSYLALPRRFDAYRTGPALPFLVEFIASPCGKGG